MSHALGVLPLYGHSYTCCAADGEAAEAQLTAFVEKALPGLPLIRGALSDYISSPDSRRAALISPNCLCRVSSQLWLGCVMAKCGDLVLGQVAVRHADCVQLL